MQEKKEQVLINKFQSLLRSGKDFDVESMCKEAGEHVFISLVTARQIINKYYRSLITKDMIGYIESLECKPIEQIDLFAEKFNVCVRESRLLIRYIKMRRDER